MRAKERVKEGGGKASLVVFTCALTYVSKNAVVYTVVVIVYVWPDESFSRPTPLLVESRVIESPPLISIAPRIEQSVPERESRGIFVPLVSAKYC